MNYTCLRHLLACLLFSIVSNALADDPTPTIPAKTEILFLKSADFDNWKGDPKYWSTEDDMIVGKTTPETPLKATTYLIFEGGEFADFEINAHFKLEGEGGNSGIQYRSKVVNDAEYKVAGYQADIDFANKFAGILYEQDGRRTVALRGESVTVGSNGKKERKRFGDSAELAKGIHPGQWNAYRIVAKGNVLEHYINGALTARVIDEQVEKAATSGIVALQLHKGPPMTVRFKNIVLQKLD